MNSRIIGVNIFDNGDSKYSNRNDCFLIEKPKKKTHHIQNNISS